MAKSIPFSASTIEAVRQAILKAKYPSTVRQISEASGRSEASCRAILNELVETDDVMRILDSSPTRYRRRGEMSTHERFWQSIYTLILDESYSIKREHADNIARRIVDEFEASGDTAALALRNDADRWNDAKPTRVARKPVVREHVERTPEDKAREIREAIERELARLVRFRKPIELKRMVSTITADNLEAYRVSEGAKFDWDENHVWYVETGA